MTTQAQTLANRRNAQKSTGPKTANGRTAVSQNAVKHGLNAASDIIAAENPADFELHRQKLLAELDPQSPLESILTERLVSLSWRLKRVCRIQNQTIDALNTPKPPSPLEKLTRSIISRNLPSFESSDSELPALRSRSETEIPCGEPTCNFNPGTSGEEGNLALGRMAVKDFSDERVLERLLMYERRLEHSLYKTILELQRLNLIRKMRPALSEVEGNQLSL